MTRNQLLNSKALWVGGGTLLGMIGGAMANKYLEDNQIPYAKPVAGATLIALGSLAMSKTKGNYRNIALGSAGAGASLVGSYAYNKVMGQELVQAQLPTGSTGGSGSTGQPPVDEDGYSYI